MSAAHIDKAVRRKIALNALADADAIRFPLDTVLGRSALPTAARFAVAAARHGWCGAPPSYRAGSPAEWADAAAERAASENAAAAPAVADLAWVLRHGSTEDCAAQLGEVWRRQYPFRPARADGDAEEVIGIGEQHGDRRYVEALDRARRLSPPHVAFARLARDISAVVDADISGKSLGEVVDHFSEVPGAVFTRAIAKALLQEARVAHRLLGVSNVEKDLGKAIDLASAFVAQPLRAQEDSGYMHLLRHSDVAGIVVNAGQRLTATRNKLDWAEIDLAAAEREGNDLGVERLRRDVRGALAQLALDESTFRVAKALRNVLAWFAAAMKWSIELGGAQELYAECLADFAALCELPLGAVERVRRARFLAEADRALRAVQARFPDYRAVFAREDRERLATRLAEAEERVVAATSPLPQLRKPDLAAAKAERDELQARLAAHDAEEV